MDLTNDKRAFLGLERNSNTMSIFLQVVRYRRDVTQKVRNGKDIGTVTTGFKFARAVKVRLQRARN